MTIAPTIRNYLEDHNIDYDVVRHPPTYTSAQTAHVCDVPESCLAKGVVLSREGGFTLAVVPSSCNVQLEAVDALIPGPVSLASEEEISAIFSDCAVGAVPPLAAAYGIDVIIDDELEDATDIYFEAGDHTSLVHVAGAQFHRANPHCPHGRISAHA